MSSTRTPIGIGVIGFGWMGQAHSRSFLRIPTLFPDRVYQPRLVLCADNVAARRDESGAFGFEEATDDWRRVIDHDEVDVVIVTAPNMLHEELCVAAAEAGKHVFCEKPVGGTPDADGAHRGGGQAGRRSSPASATTTAGRRSCCTSASCWRPIASVSSRTTAAASSRCTAATRWACCPGASWRTRAATACRATSSATPSTWPRSSSVRSPAWSGPRRRSSGSDRCPRPGARGHYAVGQPGDPTGEVTNEDFAAALVVFANGVQGTFESSRSIIGPESQMAFEVYGTKGAVSWNLER